MNLKRILEDGKHTVMIFKFSLKIISVNKVIKFIPEATCVDMGYNVCLGTFNCVTLNFHAPVNYLICHLLFFFSAFFKLFFKKI